MLFWQQKEARRVAKIDKWTDKESLKQIEAWAAECTDKELADRIGITRSTLAKWRRDNSDISDAVTRGRADVRACADVEKSLLQRALGYTTKVSKPMKMKHIEYDANGKRIREEEEIVMVEEEQHVPADVGAIRFYLTNRAPERWQNKVEMETEIHADGFEDYLMKREAEGAGSGY